MKTFITLILFSLTLASCSHSHDVLKTDNSKIVEVKLADTNRHSPKVGNPATVFDWKCEIVAKGSRSQRWSCHRENEIVGKISDIVSSDTVKVQLDKEYNVTKDTFVIIE